MRNPTALFLRGPLKTVGSCEHLGILLFTFPLRFFSQAETKSCWDFTVERCVLGEE